MKKIKWTILTVIGVLFLFCSRTVKMEAAAAEGSVLFGSEAYAWHVTDICPIGIYLNGSIPVSSYSICLEYDENVLEYLEGADRVEGNRLYIEGNGIDSSYKRMLHFMPAEEGDTAIRIVSAVGIGIRVSETGEITEENVVIVQPSPVSVAVKKKPSSKLLDLQIPGVRGMEQFEPDVTEYRLEVENSVSELEVTYKTEEENALVEVSSTKLAVGGNTVSITVQGDGADPITYILQVERKAKIEEVSEENKGAEEVSMEPAQTESMQVMTDLENESEAEKKVQNKVPITMQLSKVLQAAFIILVICIFIYLSFYRRNRKKEEQKNQRIQDVNLDMILWEQTVIYVKNVTMNFRLAQEESSSLKEYLINSLKGKQHYRTLAALKNVCFEVMQGDVLGIIGTNGSGKSTLLKIIAGALRPSEGEILVDKSKVQMLTLGTGFDMELTARENVYLNGALIGYSKEYIDKKYNDIVEFAELEGFMEERMKNFSSGMVSRLGFAIATMRDAPDILILDEVLSVGDLFFKKKSEKRIRELIHSGATVLIVSHSSEVIKANCDRAVWIEKGVMRMIGDPLEVCGAYERMGH